MLVVTAAFVPLALARRRALGTPELPLAVIPHPLGGLPPDRVHERADAAIDQVMHALTTPAAQLAAEEAARQPAPAGDRHGR